MNDCEEIKTLAVYYDVYQKLIDICVCLQNVWTAKSFDDFNVLTKNFLLHECENNFTITDLKDNINETEIKNLTYAKIPARLLKVMAHVYENSIAFPAINLNLKQLLVQIFSEIYIAYSNVIFTYITHMLQVKLKVMFMIFAVGLFAKTKLSCQLLHITFLDLMHSTS